MSCQGNEAIFWKCAESSVKAYLSGSKYLKQRIATFSDKIIYPRTLNLWVIDIQKNFTLVKSFHPIATAP